MRSSYLLSPENSWRGVLTTFVYLLLFPFFSHQNTVGLEIFARILFSRIALIDILVVWKTTEWFCHFARVIFSRNFAYAKFRENKVLAKISVFYSILQRAIRTSIYKLLQSDVRTSISKDNYSGLLFSLEVSEFPAPSGSAHALASSKSYVDPVQIQSLTRDIRGLNVPNCRLRPP